MHPRAPSTIVTRLAALATVSLLGGLLAGATAPEAAVVWLRSMPAIALDPPAGAMRPVPGAVVAPTLCVRLLGLELEASGVPDPELEDLLEIDHDPPVGSFMEWVGARIMGPGDLDREPPAPRLASLVRVWMEPWRFLLRPPAGASRLELGGVPPAGASTDPPLDEVRESYHREGASDTSDPDPWWSRLIRRRRIVDPFETPVPGPRVPPPSHTSLGTFRIRF